MDHVLALDQGTTSSRSILFDREGRPVATAQREFRQIFPKPGWVEHDPGEIWSSQVATAVEALGKASLRARDVAAVGITNQRETTVVWNHEDGKPVANAIVWQDRRTAGFCDRLRAEGVEDLVRERTGLVLDAYFSGTKIRWILDNVPGARALAEAGKLRFGTVDTWLLYRLTSGKLHVTEPSNASRTLLFNIHTGDWDDELLRIFGVPRSVLPEVRGSSEVYGEVSTSLGLQGPPIAGMAGDQQAALFGQQCTRVGMAKNTYGTGCFLLQNTGETPVASRQRLLTTIAWKRDGRLQYALEGSVFIGGAVVQWLRDGLGIIKTASETDALAATVPDSGGLVLVPAFAGLGAPHWDPYARGVLVGITRGTTAGHVARAALEAIAFQVADLLDAMQSDSGAPLPELRVDGGASQSEILLQMQADLLGRPVVRAAQTETTALGAAYLAGLAVGFWKGDDLAGHVKAGHRVEPKMEAARARSLRDRWSAAVERAKRWEIPSDEP
ncbi:MAG TPA: glycerol kinase GlpK [Vicinamibacteria bacterium]